MTVSGNQGPYWKRESIEVHSNGYEIIFQGVVGNGTEGDIAIDSVDAVERSCCKSRLCRVNINNTPDCLENIFYF